MKQGIDVSVFQGSIDWKTVSAGPTEFAIIRSGYGRELYQKDSRFEENYYGCLANSIPVGTYWYSYARDVEGARLEALACIETIKNKCFEYPVYYDVEDNSQLSLPPETIQNMVKTFCNTLEDAGYWAGIYSYSYFLSTYLNPEILKRYAVWVADISANEPVFSFPFGIWQYSHTGRIAGIGTEVDLNFAYIDYPSLIKAAGLNGFGQNCSARYYTVEPNDSLWSIARTLLGNGGRYPEIMALNHLSGTKIYPAQVLRIPIK